MPRLPDKEALGGIPGLRSGRTYATAADAKEDVSGQEASSIALANGFTQMAKTVEGIGADQVQQEDALDLIRANTSHATKLRDLQNEFDTDPDWKTYRPRFAEAATQGAEDSSQEIRSPKLRARWIEQANERNSASMDRVLDRGTRLSKEHKEIEVGKALEVYRNLYSTAPDEATRKQLLADMDVIVNAGQRTGLLDMSRGEGLREKAVNDTLREDAERRMLAGDSIGVMRDLGALNDPNKPKKTGPSLRHDVQVAINAAAEKYNVDAGLLSTIARIESGGDPNNVTGSYKGVFQLSDAEFRKAGGRGSVFDANANADAAAIKLKAESETFAAKYGRAPTAAEIYMIHQQGEGGSDAHWKNPDQLAWKSMASTGEGREKGAKWAKEAIWGNVPDDMKAKYGSVDNITSAQFTQMWAEKVDRMGGGDQLSGPYARMSFAARHALITRSKVAMSAETQQDLRDAYEDVKDTGEAKRGADGMTALDRARLFLQPNQVKRAELQLEEARMINAAVAPLRGMSEADAVTHLTKFQDRTATGERAATMRKVQQAAEKAWSEVQDERMNDPAEAVDPFKNVRTAKAGRTRRADEVAGAYDLVKRRFPNVAVRETVAGGYEIMDPEVPTPEALAETHRARRAVIDARIEAQSKLGVPIHNRKPISQREADDLLQFPEDVNAWTPNVYRNKMLEAADRAEAKYGAELGPVMLETALSMRKKGDAAHKEQADTIVRRLLRGEKVTQSSIKSLNDLQDLEKRTRIFDRPSEEQGRQSPPSYVPPYMPPPAPASTKSSVRPSTGVALPTKDTAPGERPPPRRTQSGAHKRLPQDANPYDALD